MLKSVFERLSLQKIEYEMERADIPDIFFVEKDYDSWCPKIHGPRNYLQSFYVSDLIDKFETNKHHPLAMFRNGI